MNVYRLCRLFLALVVCLLTVVQQAEAQPGLRARKGGIGAKKGPLRLPGGANRLEALERMTPEQQERFLESLPPPRRAQAKRMLGRWRDMSPEERARARQTLGEFQDLAPDRQRRIRMLFGQFNQFPSDRQTAMRAELRQLRRLDSTESRARIDSEEFRTKFSAGEQRLLTDLSEALPRQGEDDQQREEE